MDKIKSQTFILSMNDFGQKIFTSQSDPDKKYILSDDGNMMEYHPETSICTVQLNSDGNICEENSSDTTNSDCTPNQFTTSGIMNSFDNVPELEDHFINDLDSDFMDMMPNPPSQYIMQHMDIREPLTKLRKLIENRLGVKLQTYVFALQGVQILEDHKNLVDQCVQGEGLVQINVQVQTNLKRINIIDVLKPAEDYIPMDNIDDTSDKEELDKTSTSNEEDVPKSIVQWQVDINFKKEQERLKIPSDPVEWTTVHVRHWVQWAVRQFNLPNIKLSDWTMNGKALCNLTMLDFQKIVPKDPGDIFWTHLELLKRMKVVAVKKTDNTCKKLLRRTKASMKKNVNVNYSTALRYFDHSHFPTSGYKMGSGGQIQLWQFLLELLTSRRYKSIIQWIGSNGEFRLNHPEVVATLWGERKNKPMMNYEKLSRALRYYYDGDMICKVHGKRFVYKFVCDLKQLLGYSAIELANLVKYGNPAYSE